MNKKLVVANWKMNPNKGIIAKNMLRAILKKTNTLKRTTTVICPPSIFLESLGELIPKARTTCVLGAQDVFWERSGAYTGQISSDMVHDARARFVIIGHSELRDMGETNEIVNAKVKAVLRKSMIPIVCVGEIKRDFDMQYVKHVRMQIKKAIYGLTRSQIARVVIAYEPIWAIGKDPEHACTPVECAEMVRIVRQTLADVLGSTESVRTIPILYGGSVEMENIKDFFTEGMVDGVLVGHASLNMKIFNKMLTLVDKLSS